MSPSDIAEWYTAAAPVVLGVGAFLAIALPILGRLIATWKPRAGEALIRAGVDIGGAIATHKLEPGTPSVSAQPILESSAAVAASQPSVRPPPDLKPPSLPPLPILMALLAVGCAGGAGQADRAIETFADALSTGERVTRAAYAREVEACPDAACVERVKKEYEPAIAKYDAAHKLWCSIAPSAEGC